MLSWTSVGDIFLMDGLSGYFCGIIPKILQDQNSYQTSLTCSHAVFLFSVAGIFHLISPLRLSGVPISLRNEMR